MLTNRYLFSQAYIDEITRNPVKGDQDGAFFDTIKGWLLDAEFETKQSAMDTFIEPVLNTVGFALKRIDNTFSLLYSDYSFNTSLAALCVIDSDYSMDSSVKGAHWSQKLVKIMKDNHLNWGLFTDGQRWRLYNTVQVAPLETYVEIDLVHAIQARNEVDFRAFLQFMTRDAFMEGRVETHIHLSGEAVRRIEIHLQNQVEEVLKRLCYGFIQDEGKARYTEQERAAIFENAVYMLYRILFIFYAESRCLLPVDQPEYDVHSLQKLLEKAADMHRGMAPSNGTSLWNSLLKLCSWIDKGYKEETFEIAPYNGGLFDNRTKPYLSSHKIKDEYLAEVLWYLGCIADAATGYSKIDYRDLSVRHLGSLYEGILEYKLFIAEEDMFIRATADGNIEFIPRREAGPKRKGEEELDKGQVYFAQSQGARKASGSYYTREEIVAYNVKYAVIGGLEERWQCFLPTLDGYIKDLDIALDQAEKQRMQHFVDNEVCKFVEESLLTYRVCDPAMGSGHFLVNATYAITNYIVDVLNYTPWENTQVNSDPVKWRRRVVESCIFGVDINKLAVELAKLSLWITAAAVGKPLSYLDHHLKTGNSLAGVKITQLLDISVKKLKKQKRAIPIDLFIPNHFADELQRALLHYARIMAQDSDTIEIVHNKKKEQQQAEESVASIKALADIWMGFSLGIEIEPLDYYKIYRSVSQGNNFLDEYINAAIREAIDFGKSEMFIHWEIEFPEVFVAGNGFNAVIGNPPWEAWKPNSQEFFEIYISGFRRLDKQQALIAVDELLRNNEDIKNKWENWQYYFARYSDYFLGGTTYSYQTAVVDGKKTGSDINLFKLFTEQFHNLLMEGGRCAIVTPSGVYSDMGTTGLRRILFERACIHSLYCFENRKGIFPTVHRSFKFVVLTYIKGGNTNSFLGAFYINDVEELERLDTKALRIPVKVVKSLAPDTWSVMEFNEQKDIDIIQRMYQFPTLGEDIPGKWQLKFTAEFHMTNDSEYFNTKCRGNVLYEGKMMHQYTHTLSEPHYWVDRNGIQKLVEKETKRVQAELVNRFAPGLEGTKSEVLKNLLRLFRDKDYLDGDDILLGCELYRIVYRNIARSTDERTLIATILPPGVCCGHSLAVQIPYKLKAHFSRELLSGRAYQKLLYENTMTVTEQCFSVALLNSFVVDYVIRQKITTNLSMFYLYQLPFPRFSDGDSYFGEIASRSARLICNSELYEGLAANVEVPCEQLDIGSRQTLQNEIDAYVAKIYGLTRNELAHVLGRFPLVKQEIKDGVLAAFAALEDNHEIASL